ncbi:regulatory iron-sulfur-containing complex subunit RicT [bacterium]|nr:regulatory iron-sulfur-containing complex subunit RicT [bacterium]
MGCASCSTTKNGVPQGCGDKGHCSSGSCNKKNTFDWLATLDLHDPMAFQIVEVSFKKGNHKGFYLNPPHADAMTGDMVVVESTNGYDVGRIDLSGDLVRLQMKKKKKDEASVIHKVIRVANTRDLEKLDEARQMEKKAMVRARVLARTLDLDMKIGDVEYQGDKRKATFYYTAEGRVDFRELVRVFAKDFRVKIEMRQIGSRQESSIIGGIGTCGRELCCSTWKSNFETVTTTAARYQNLAINQTKLTGQCGRLKCCLNYELDTYIDALGDFPKHADKIRLDNGLATLIKTDIFKGIMYYSVQRDNIKGPLLPLSIAQVKKLLALNKDGIKIKDIDKMEEPGKPKEVDLENIEHEFADVTGEIVLPELKRRNKGRNNRKKPNSKNKGPRRNDRKDGGPKSENKSGKPEAKRRENPNKEKSNNPPRAINTGGQKSDNKDNQGPKSESKGDGQNKSRNNNRKKFDRNKNKPNQNNSNDNKAE